jgi:hypothetical protein
MGALKMDRRAFIAALFGGTVTMRYADGTLLAAPIPDVQPSPWKQHYNYSLLFGSPIQPMGREVRRALKFNRNFWLTSIGWQVPPLTVIEIWQPVQEIPVPWGSSTWEVDANGEAKMLLASGTTLPSSFRLGLGPILPAIVIPAGESLIIVLKNIGCGGSAVLMLSGQQEITEAEAMAERGALDPDDLEDEYEGPAE